MRTHLARMYDRRRYSEGRARHTAAAYCAPDRTAELRNVVCPALVVHGDEDPLIDVSGGRAVADAINGARLLEIKGMGHYIVPEVYKEIATAIRTLADGSRE